MQIHTFTDSGMLWLAPASAGSEDGKPEPSSPEQRGDVQALRVLIVEDEFFISLETKSVLLGLGHAVVAIAVSADEAVRVAEQERPDVVLMDIRLVGARDGIEAASEIRNRFDIPSIFVTANTDRDTRGRAQAVAPVAFLEKPLTEARLRAVLATLV
jgi:CheY-like chemotaxis protein